MSKEVATLVDERGKIIQSFLPALKWVKDNEDEEAFNELLEWIEVTLSGSSKNAEATV